MKHCTLCKQDRPLTEFNKKKRNKDGLQDICRECNRRRSRQYYRDNHDKHIKAIAANKKRYISRAREIIAEAKAQGCAVCKENEPICLDFHHINPNKKDFLLSSISNGSITSAKRIKKEIDKCIVLCSNCHRKVHAGIIVL